MTEPEAKARERQFKEAWSRKEAEGYQYGSDALEGVRLGYDIALDESPLHVLTTAAMKRATADGLEMTIRVKPMRKRSTKP